MIGGQITIAQQKRRIAELEAQVEQHKAAEEMQIALREKADEREAALACRNAGLIKQCEAAERQRDEHLNKLRSLNHGDASAAWRWIGDGNDYPESLCCPVLISAEDLNAIIAERDAAIEREAALAAHVEKLRDHVAFIRTLAVYAKENQIVDRCDVIARIETPATSLARRDAAMKLEGFHGYIKRKDSLAELLEYKSELRREADKC